MPLPKDSADDISLPFLKNTKNTPRASLPEHAGKIPLPTKEGPPDTPTPLDSANPLYAPILTKDELAEISTRKVRIILPSENARRTRASMAEIATKKMSVTLPAVPASKNGA